MGQVVSCFGPAQAGQEQEHEQQKDLVALQAAPKPAATPAAAVAKLSSDGSPPAAAGQAPEKETAFVKDAAADKFVDAADKDDDGPAWSTDNDHADEDFNPGTTPMLLGAEVCPGPWDLNCKGIPLPPNEQARRDTAVALNLFGAAHCAELDFVLETLQRIFDAPYASIALYYNKACWLANTRNLAAGRMMWRLAACPWNCLVKQPQTIVCGDLMEDARFRHQPWIKGGLRCYCSAPLLASNGHRLGTICFMDGVPRKVDAGMCRVLNNFGEIAVRVLERHLQLVQRLEAAHQAAPEQLEAFMHAASKAKPLQRQTSQGLAIQGPDAGNWALANGLQRGNTFDRRASGITAGLSRANSRDDSGCAGRSPADVLLQAAFSRQLRHPDVLLDACVLIVDTSMPGWTILYADETFKQWSGFSRADILGQRLSDVLRPGAPGVAPLNWEAMQSQADAHERFLLSGLVAVNPTEASTDSSNTQAAAGDAPAAAAAAATAATPVADGAAGTAQSTPAAGAPAAELVASSVLADGAPVGPQAPLLAAAVTTSGEPLGPLATALAREPSYSQPSAEYLLEQVQVLEHAHRASVETQLATIAQASGVQLGHEAAGSFLLTSSSRPHSIPNTSQQLGPGTAGNSMQFTTSGPLPSGAAAMGSGQEGQEAEGAPPASGTLPSPRVFDLTFRPAALDVLDEDTLPLGMPSFVPLEACEPVLRLYVVRLHERLSLPPPPQPLTPSIKLAGRYSSTLAQLSSYLFPGLEIGQVLGRGGYGTAYAGQWHDVHVVVKVEDHELQDAQALRQAQLEISLGQLLRHPNLVRTLGHGAVELPPPPEKTQQREGRQPRPSPPRPRAPAAAPQDARAPAESAASATKSEGAGTGGVVAAAPGMQGAGREPGQAAFPVQQQRQDDATSRVDMTTDSAAFDMFGGQLLQWMTNAEGPGDHFGEDKWMSHCDSADLWRRELFSRTSTWNVELPDPQLMINASSIARDAGAPPLSSRTNSSFQGGSGFMVNDKVDVGPGAPHFVMEAIQEEAAPSGSIKSSAQHCVPPRESNSACGVATLEASSTGSHPAASTATVATSSEDAAAPHSRPVEATGSSQQAGSDATPASTSGAATPQQLNSAGASDTSAAAVSYHVPLAATAMLGLSPFKAAHDASSTTGLTCSSTSSCTASAGAPAAAAEWPGAAAPSSAESSAEGGKEGPAAVVPSSAPPLHQGQLDGGVDAPAAQASSAAAAAGVPGPAMASAPPAAGASSPNLLSGGVGNGGSTSAGALGGSAAADQGSRLLTSRTSSRDASAEVAALLKSGEMHATRVHAKPMHFPLFLRTFSILEFCDGGTLQDAIDRGWLRMGTTHVRNPPNIPKVLQLALDIARGVAHLHERGVVHADLSANNVLLCKQQHKHAPGSAAKLQRSNSQGGIATGAAAPQPGAAAPGLYTLPIRRYSLAPERPQTADEMEFVAKVSDLGKACLLGADGVVKVGSYATITHSAPEVLRERLLSPAADLYALGVLMWQMYTASRPYASLGHAQIMAVVMHGTLALEWPAPQQLGVRPHFLAAAEQLVQLGTRCLSFEPAHRPTAAEAVEQLGALLAQVRAVASPAAPAQLQKEGAPQALAEAARAEAGPGAAELRAAGVVFGC